MVQNQEFDKQKRNENEINQTDCCCSFAGEAFAASTVSDVVARQRWPWNGKVDIDYTLTGDKTDVDFYATWDGQTTPTIIGTAEAALRAVPDAECSLELVNGLSPIVLNPCDGSRRFSYMVLPVRLKAGE